MNTNRLRLSIVTPAHWKAFMGGAQYQVKCILDALIPLGKYEIDYFARRVDPDFVPVGYRVNPIGTGGGVPRFGYVMDFRKFNRALQAARPQVIYQRVGCGYTGLAAHYARQHGARLIWHVAHDNDLMPGRQLGARNAVREYLEKRSIEYGIRHAHHIVTQTESQAALLQKFYGRRATAVIPNFHPEPDEAIDKSGPKTVLWVANFKRWKQPEVFVRMAHRLRDLEGVRFLMVGAAAGGADEAWNAEVMRGIQAASSIEYLGQKSQDEVNALLAQSHLFVNTSEHEGFANTFIQAWMRHVPVVSLSINPDGLFDREPIGICAGNEERLAESVRKLIVDDALRVRFASDAAAYALRKHSIRNVRSLIELIDSGTDDAAKLR